MLLERKVLIQPRLLLLTKSDLSQNKNSSLSFQSIVKSCNMKSLKLIDMISSQKFLRVQGKLKSHSTDLEDLLVNKQVVSMIK